MGVNDTFRKRLFTKRKLGAGFVTSLRKAPHFGKKMLGNETIVDLTEKPTLAVRKGIIVAEGLRMYIVGIYQEVQ